MPKLKGLVDPKDAVRKEAYKRRISAKRNESLVSVIEKFRDQQKQSPKKPSEAKKLISEISDYVDALADFRESAAKIQTELKVPTMPTIRRPQSNIAPDAADVFLVAAAAALTALTPFLRKLGVIKKEP